MDGSPSALRMCCMCRVWCSVFFDASLLYVLSLLLNSELFRPPQCVSKWHVEIASECTHDSSGNRSAVIRCEVNCGRYVARNRFPSVTPPASRISRAIFDSTTVPSGSFIFEFPSSSSRQLVKVSQPRFIAFAWMALRVDPMDANRRAPIMHTQLVTPIQWVITK